MNWRIYTFSDDNITTKTNNVTLAYRTNTIQALGRLLWEVGGSRRLKIVLKYLIFPPREAYVKQWTSTGL